MRAIGAISGTSMDGVDVSFVETDGEAFVRPGVGATYSYPAALRAQLLDLIANPERAQAEPLEALEAAVTDAHAGAIDTFIRAQGLSHETIDLVGLHGQTVFHNPLQRFTRQLGLGQQAADQLRIKVVNRFRHADVAAGGEGAPLVPLYHRALASTLEQPLMVLNYGGVGNVTYLAGETIIAFDTGPASAMLDDFMLTRRGVPFDEGGRLAASGTPNAAMVGAFLRNPYFDRPAPKSLDRQEFHERGMVVEALGDADGAATLAAFTIESTVAALRHVPAAPKRWLVTGGGRLNETFMQGLRARLGVPVEPVEAVGWQGDYLEAQCFAYLAVRALRGLPLSLPTTTGVPEPMSGGTVWTPR
jgi:anhydro-N-acetylmuramic acid kinase